MSSPSKRTVPALAGCTPEIVRSSVVLPAPLAPTSATSSPSATREADAVQRRMRP